LVLVQIVVSVAKINEILPPHGGKMESCQLVPTGVGEDHIPRVREDRLSPVEEN
jgi:hypothetical protein